MVLDHTADLLRLSLLRRDLQKIGTGLVRSIAATGDRKLAANVEMNLGAAANNIKWATDNIQAPKKDDSGIPEREALQL